MTETSTPSATLAPAARPSGLRVPFGRRGLILGAMAVVGAGFWLNWGWLTAIGAAPLILSLAPLRGDVRAGHLLHEERLEIVLQQEQSGRRAGIREGLKRNQEETTMRTTTKLGIPAAALAALLATAAVAQEAGDKAPDQSMQNRESMSGNMMNGGMYDMEGMHGMMQMMALMGPMMEACTEMMQAANETGAPAAEPQEG